VFICIELCVELCVAQMYSLLGDRPKLEQAQLEKCIAACKTYIIDATAAGTTDAPLKPLGTLDGGERDGCSHSDRGGAGDGGGDSDGDGDGDDDTGRVVDGAIVETGTSTVDHTYGDTADGDTADVGNVDGGNADGDGGDDKDDNDDDDDGNEAGDRVGVDECVGHDSSSVSSKPTAEYVSILETVSEKSFPSDPSLLHTASTADLTRATLFHTTSRLWQLYPNSVQGHNKRIKILEKVHSMLQQLGAATSPALAAGMCCIDLLGPFVAL
jgi:hypothetical protein